LRIAAVVLLFLLAAPVHMAAKLLLRRSPVPPWFLGMVARLIGVRVRTSGAPIRPHTLLVANHTSWIDILALARATRCAFVSKDELGHPLVHWLADQNATVYVKRGHRKGAKDQASTIALALERDRPVALFPEGTTGPGTHLLPFRSTLLEAANFAAREVQIRPVAIDYGAAASAVGWWEEKGKNNVLRLLARKGTLMVRVNVLDPMDRSLDRKQLAHRAREAIAQTLGLTSSAHSPIGGEK
jgi:lyso-ornithine lipid O-acyltransferase